MAKDPITDWIALAAHGLSENPGEAADLMARWCRTNLQEARAKQCDLLEAGLLESSRDGIQLSQQGQDKLEGYARLLGRYLTPKTK